MTDTEATITRLEAEVAELRRNRDALEAWVKAMSAIMWGDTDHLPPSLFGQRLHS